MASRQYNGRHWLRRFWESGPLALDTLKMRAYIADVDLEVSEEQFDALYLLVQRAGEAMSFDDLYSAAWELPDGGGQRDAAEQDMARLVEKCADAGKGMVQIEMLPEKKYRIATT